MMRVKLKSALLFLLLYVLNYEYGFAQPVRLDPDSIDKFVMDPATFNENENSNSIWKHAPFGRKEPTRYTSGRKKNVEAIIIAESNSSISSVKTDIQANAQEFPLSNGPER